MPRLTIATSDWRCHGGVPEVTSSLFEKPRSVPRLGYSKQKGVVGLVSVRIKYVPLGRKKKMDERNRNKKCRAYRTSWPSFRPAPSPHPPLLPSTRPPRPFVRPRTYPAPFFCTWLPSLRRWLTPTARQEQQPASKSVSHSSQHEKPPLHCTSHTSHFSSEDSPFQ